ncbi:hypothetical protein EY643_02540 [Halioglobus maricola]|uniref:Nucleotidyltransferase family protein n=1 Tax=Halioglobus maricola TaxID=2601894 RepID=A0A5P9NFS2_9GAMM|nr:nucleotidyltransferase family protein [Halioglobus maricola]QFU74621.1 hypothetical protein EY643_02540 [Halioglobus maricola]
MLSNLQFAIYCCKTQLSEDDVSILKNDIQERDDESIRKLINFVLSQQVFPQFHRCIINHATELLSQPIMVELEEYNLSIVVSNIGITGELIQIHKLCADRSIRILPFKGPAMAIKAYQDVGSRQFSDLDILIERQDFKSFSDILSSRGYKPLYPIDKYKSKNVLFKMNNDCPFYHGKKNFVVEVHWDFFRKLALPTRVFEPWKNTELVNIKGHNVSILSPENQLLYHSLHGSKHLWEKLLWIVDLDRYIRSNPDINWNEILRKARTLGAQRLFILGIALSHEYFDTPLPQEIERVCKNQNFTSISVLIESVLNNECPGTLDSIAKVGKLITLRDNPYFKSKMILEYVFKPGINEREMIILPKQLFFLYWLLRPLRLAKDYLF